MRVGLIGCGNISDIYLRNQNHFEGFGIVAVADLRTEAALEKSREFGAEAISVDAMMDRDDIDTILNLTIPAAHAPLALAAIAAGKHVYLEKPLATTLEDARSILDAAAKAGVRVGSAPDTILGPGIQTAKTLIDEGNIGKPLLANASMMTHGMEARHPNPDFFFKPGGGPVLDMGPYYVSMITTLMGAVSSVDAHGMIGFAERTITAPGAPRYGEAIRVETFTTVQGVLRMESGAQVSFSYSWDVWKHNHPPLEIHGTLGSLRLPDPNFFGGQLQMAIGREPVKIIDTLDMPFGKPNFPDISMPGFPPELYNSLANYRGIGLADMADAIAMDRPIRASGELAYHVLDVLLAIVRSATEERSVQVASRLTTHTS